MEGFKMSVKEAFANRLKHLREIAKLTQVQLAEKLGISRGSISYYENCERTPDIEVLSKVAELFDVNIDYLMGYSENAHSDCEEAGLYTRLTDKAIDVLFNANFDVEPLSKLIENEEFDKFMLFFGYLCEYYRDLNKYLDSKYFMPETEYLSFLLVQTLMPMIHNVAMSIGYKNITKKEIQMIHKENEKILVSLKEFEDRIGEISKSNISEYRNKHKDEIDIRKRIHAHFSKGDNSNATQD